MFLDFGSLEDFGLSFDCWVVVVCFVCLVVWLFLGFSWNLTFSEI